MSFEALVLSFKMINTFSFSYVSQSPKNFLLCADFAYTGKPLVSVLSLNVVLNQENVIENLLYMRRLSKNDINHLYP